MVLPVKRSPGGSFQQFQVGDIVELPGLIISDATASGRIIGTPTQGFNELFLNKHASAGSQPTARSLADITAASGAGLIGVNTAPLVISSPLAADLQSVLEAMDAAIGSGGATLQTAYNAGNTITEGLNGVLISQGSGSPTDTYVLRINANIGAGNPVDGLLIQKAPTPVGDSGTGITVLMGANTAGEGISVLATGSGTGVLVVHNGSGNGLEIDTTSGTGDGLAVQVASGQDPIKSSINGVNALTIDGAAMRMDIGTASAPITVLGYSRVTMGSAPAATLLGYQGFTNTGLVVDISNLGRMYWRAGSGTVAATVADLFHASGTAGSVQVTKGNRLFSRTTIEEIPIENGETLAFGDVVAAGPTAGRCYRAEAKATQRPHVLGVCLVGGTGNLAGTVYALVATAGVVTGLSGLTARSKVYLSVAATGQLESGTGVNNFIGPATAAPGDFVIRMGFAYDTTSMVLCIGEGVVL